MELISKDEAMRLLKEDLDASRSRGDDERADACLLHCIEISNLPTVEEREEGRWIRTEGELICSICEYPAEFNPLSSDFIESNYCPNCGARMKGE